MPSQYTKSFAHCDEAQALKKSMDDVTIDDQEEPVHITNEIGEPPPLTSQICIAPATRLLLYTHLCE
eukprot:914970-Pyramimonas_sp.AAC.1